ncbi:MAG: adenylate/guanylate cyclase domain-containing protein [Gordonia sp. (in: high G+C Gram-positive bacteria)]|uniref:adenylate/guanylate cyclase domain-containing protein n=1 Tax=Gordonia sp. (in: high G+C Gram-positive bacteria) TaxID=84139 RepID=UPI003BB5CE8C
MNGGVNDACDEGDDDSYAVTPLQKASSLLARTDASAPLVRAAQFARRLTPPDRMNVGSTTLDRLSSAIGDVNAQRPSAVRELGLATVGVWKSLVRRTLPDPSGPTPVTIMFTDLVDFSRWALRAGDDQVLELLNAVNQVSEQVINARGGQVVKTLGDGMMAAFVDGREAIEGAHEAAGAVSALQIGTYRPALRAGVHTGAPRAVGDDFLGVDVNIAARVCAAAGAGEVLASGSTLELAGADGYLIKRKRFKAKGVPKELQVYRVVPRYDQGGPHSL